MAAANNRYQISIIVDQFKLKQTLLVLPAIIFALAALTYIVVDLTGVSRPAEPITAETAAPADVQAVADSFRQNASYPASGAELNTNLFAMRLPPPPLDAVPYDVRHPLSNGTSVPVKKRWLWVPTGQAITVSEDGSRVDVPDGTMWWKEFYLETDRGVFLIERRVTLKVPVSNRYPEGWAFFSAHHMPAQWEPNVPVRLSTGEAGQFFFQPTDWIPTQNEAQTVEVRFADERGVEFPYIFPGQTQCMVCHGGAAAAYPNPDDDPIFAFGLHPNNLTPESFMALVQRGWIRNGERILTASAEPLPSDELSLDELTHQVVGVMRNNCTSCHNTSVHAAANFSGFLLDPNREYTTEELIELFHVNGRMIPEAFPLVTPGSLEESELWLRVNGLEGRRRMPPSEGGLPDIDPAVVELIRTWILRTGQS